MSLRLNLSNDELRTRFSSLTTREDIAQLLDVTDYKLRYHLYISASNQRYKVFNIPKKSGRNRIISAPRSAIKILQQKLNQVLHSVYESKAPVHGFTLKKSVVTNASMHLRQRYILNLDLEDFFPSINFGRVRGLFLSAPYNCKPAVATVLAQICCHNNSLPQGAPTSPIISNMICAQMDSQLRRLAQKHRCIYTRYADDITFSTSLSRFPQSLAYNYDQFGQLIIGKEMKQIIEDNGFKINLNKVRLQTRSHSQEVTGIIVNSKLNVSRRYVRQIRAMLHAWEKHGLDNAQTEFWAKHDDKWRNSSSSKPSFKRVVKGKIAYLGMVRGKFDDIYLKFLTQLQKLAPELVKKSQVSKVELLELPCPEIWTEGKTDWKHLKAALHILQDKGYFRKLQLNFKEDLEEDKQGSTELLAMCKQYRKSPRAIPMIAIFDRDEPKILEQVHDDRENYKKWANGLYSFALPVPTHRVSTPEVCMELYYKDSEIQRTDSSGRRLFLNKEFSLTGRHTIERHIIAGEKNKIRAKHIVIIDDEVFDDTDKNIALPKDDFAENVKNAVHGFHDFDFTEFRAIFELIETILRQHVVDSKIA